LLAIFYFAAAIFSTIAAANFIFPRFILVVVGDQFSLDSLHLASHSLLFGLRSLNFGFRRMNFDLHR
jgi:hypothetical protein